MKFNSVSRAVPRRLVFNSDDLRLDGSFQSSPVPGTIDKRKYGATGNKIRKLKGMRTEVDDTARLFSLVEVKCKKKETERAKKCRTNGNQSDHPE